MIFAEGSSDLDKAAPIGLFVILVLLVVSWFLARSMMRQIRKVPPSFDKDAATEPAPTEGRLGTATHAETEPSSIPHASRMQTPPRLGTPDEYARRARAKKSKKRDDQALIAERKRKLAERQKRKGARPADSRTKAARDNRH